MVDLAEERRLIEASLCGDGDAFACLVREHQQMIHSLTYRMTSSWSDAQETFVQAYRQLGAFRSQARFSSWLYRIAVNKCLNSLQSRKREEQGRIEIKVRRRIGGSIIAVDRQSSVAVDVAEQTAAKTALQNAADVLAERILPQLIRKSGNGRLFYFRDEAPARPRIRLLRNRSRGGSSSKINVCRTLSRSAEGWAARTFSTRADNRFAQRLAPAAVFDRAHRFIQPPNLILPLVFVSPKRTA
jgi:RNA polymerase sigma factor (sigma-70 family)